MNTPMTVSGGGGIPAAATLEQLAQRANQAHAQAIGAAQNAVEQALAAGHALLEAKKQCRPGTWHVWLTENFRGSIRTAQGYMRLAVHAPQIDYDAHGRAHLTYDQLRCMLTGLSATDGRAKPARKRRAAIEIAVSSATPPEQRLCGEPTCLRLVSVPPDFANVAESLLETLKDLAVIADSQTDAGYALHLFERLRMVYFGLANQRWFHEWQVKPSQP